MRRIASIALFSSLVALSAAVLAVFASGLGAQAASEASRPAATGRFAPLDWLVGEWQGYGLFPDDTTYVRKVFGYELGGRFLVEETIDVFPPPQPTTEYQIHRDRLYYYPRGDGFALKGFFVEGFVWNAGVTVAGDTVRIVTEEVEGGPPGLGARVTIVRGGADRYRGTFELGSSERGYRTLERLTMRRVSGG